MLMCQLVKERVSLSENAAVTRLCRPLYIWDCKGSSFILLCQASPEIFFYFILGRCFPRKRLKKKVLGLVCSTVSLIWDCKVTDYFRLCQAPQRKFLATGTNKKANSLTDTPVNAQKNFKLFLTELDTLDQMVLFPLSN
jgi:hypothetical protein